MGDLYTNRNGARTPAYHRLDISGYYTIPIKRKHLYVFPFAWLWRKYETPEGLQEKSSELGIAFGAYNMYARKNPYSIYFQASEVDPDETQAYQLSIYATIIPYVTLNFKF
jgi:hypothetical protein